MKLKPNAHIDLTGHLGSLKSSLTPACKLFESTPPLYQLTHRPHPAASFFPLTLAAILLWTAIIAYYLS